MKFNLLFLLIGISLTINAQSKTTKTRPKILNTINKLRKDARLHLGEPVGYSGIPEKNNKYYKLYRKLGQIATDEELVQFTDDSLNTIVAYCFTLLHSRSYVGLKTIFLKHINDSTSFWIASGCTGSFCNINSFMLGQMNPAYSDSKQTYLTQQEYEEFKKRINNITTKFPK